MFALWMDYGQNKVPDEARRRAKHPVDGWWRDPVTTGKHATARAERAKAKRRKRK